MLRISRVRQWGSGRPEFELANTGEIVFELAKILRHFTNFEGPTEGSGRLDFELANKGENVFEFAKTSDSWGAFSISQYGDNCFQVCEKLAKNSESSVGSEF